MTTRDTESMGETPSEDETDWKVIQKEFKGGAGTDKLKAWCKDNDIQYQNKQATMKILQHHRCNLKE